MAIPDDVEQRIRRPPPVGSFVVPGSTPVVSFGNVETATVATLGLNPSRVEFLDQAGAELVRPSRRLATHSSLGISDLSIAPQETIAHVLDDSNRYFERNPYRRWFDQLMPILQACRASYFDGTACHLDLVQWATDPIWGKLGPAAVRRQLPADDIPFLAQQLRSGNIGLLLVNGMGAVRQVCRMTDSLEQVEVLSDYGCHDTRLFAGTIYGYIRVVGWSTNIQSSHGVTNELRLDLAQQVPRIAR